MELEELTYHDGEWLKGSGPESDIVISSRIRLARNLADYPFISRVGDQDRAEIEKALRQCVLGLNESEDIFYVDVDGLSLIHI